MSGDSLVIALNATLDDGVMAKFKEMLVQFRAKATDDLTTQLIFLKDAAVLFGAKSSTLLPLLEAALENNQLPSVDRLISKKPANPLQAHCSLPVDSLTLPEEIFSVYVGDLASTVTESDLREAFASQSGLKEVAVIKDKATNACKGYGFLQFSDKLARDNVLSSRSPVIVHGRTVRLKLSEEKLCVFVGNLDTSQSPEVLQQALHHILDPIIPVDAMTIEVKAGHDGLTRGYGFVTCRSQPFAELVRQMLGASSMSGRPLVAKWADSQKPPNTDGKGDMDVYVANLSLDLNDEDLRNHFKSCGEIYKCTITRDPNTGQSRGFGFVGFVSRDAVELAISSLNDTLLGNQRIRVSSARSNFTERTSRQPARGGFNSRGWGQHGTPYGSHANLPQNSYGQGSSGRNYDQGYPQPYGAPSNSHSYAPFSSSYPTYQTPHARPTQPYTNY